MAQRSSLMGNDDFGVLTRLGSAAIARRLGRVLEFMRVLWAVDHALQSTSKWMEVRLGVTGPQRLVIRMIGCFPGISAGALANLLYVHPSTLTGVLRRLSERGAIRRSADPYDSRRALFWLTARRRRSRAPWEERPRATWRRRGACSDAWPSSSIVKSRGRARRRLSAAGRCDRGRALPVRPSAKGGAGRAS